MEPMATRDTRDGFLLRAIVWGRSLEVCQIGLRRVFKLVQAFIPSLNGVAQRLTQSHLIVCRDCSQQAPEFRVDISYRDALRSHSHALLLFYLLASARRYLGSIDWNQTLSPLKQSVNRLFACEAQQ